MFLDKLIRTNEGLAECAFDYHRAGLLSPDTYVIDLDMVTKNARLIQEAAGRCGIDVYFMLKQLGRNPLVGRRLQELGLAGAVCVDWRDAEAMIAAGVRIGHVGHLVQVPRSKMSSIIAARPEVMTVYSIEKAREAGAVATDLGLTQKVLLRVLCPHDQLYSGQYGGFVLDDLARVVEEVEKIPGVRIAGVCSFPCLCYSEEEDNFVPTNNAETVRETAQFLCDRGYEDVQLNMPSASCAESMGVVSRLGGTHVEPGHGLTGTTPYHACHEDALEGIGYVYLSEVSHNLGTSAYCFGGGHYRRGHLRNALVGKDLQHSRRVTVTPPTDESIDYHFCLSENASVGDAVLMCFRTQMFVTRSEVAVVSGLSEGRPHLDGLFDSQGRIIE